MSSESGIRLALLLTVVLLASLLSLAAFNVRAVETTARWVEHTQAVETRLATVLADLVALEAGQRGYVITGDREFLGEVDEGARDLAPGLDDLERLVSDNQAQGGRVKSLREAVKGKREFGEAVIALASSGQRDQAALKVGSGEGRRWMRQATGILSAMRAEEERLLSERTGAMRSALHRQTWTELALGLIFLGFLGGLYLFAQGERRATRESHRFLDAVVESLPAMIFIKEAPDLRFVRFNRAGEDLLGLKRAELMGKNDFDFFPREQAEFFVNKDRETLAAGVLLDIPEEPIQTAGGERWLHTRKVPLADAQGRLRYLLGVSEDITEARAHRLSLARAKETAEAASRELEAFSYSVSHDLRAPLRAIDGFSQAILEDCGKELPDPARAHLERVMGAARRMGQLIDDLLALSRINRAEVARATVDLSRLSQEVLSALQERDPARLVTAKVEAGLTTVGDPSLLRVALENLLGNAWKFSAKKASATIEVGRENGAFFVRDDGAGFDARHSGKLFGAFQRLHSPSEFEGTGIGLAIVQRVIHRHRGRIWAESQPGAGATFRFTLEPEGRGSG